MGHREHLPQLDGDLFLTDGGIETTLIFNEGIDLPLFAAFTLLSDEEGVETLRGYYEPYVRLAAEHGAGFVLESPTWRASPRWAAELGYSDAELEQANRSAIGLMEEIRDAHGGPGTPDLFVISGCVGPHGDGYAPAELLTEEQAREYHSTQISTFADTAADLVTAITMTYADEAVGLALAAADAGIAAAVSFTTETDGRLPSGQPLAEAVAEVDERTDSYPAYLMVNCAHPTHFEGALESSGPWIDRIRGVRANASTQSHAELDEATELDAGDPEDLGARYAELRERLPGLSVLGGCCGTDVRHLRAIAAAWRG